jgi:leucine efflux protein
MTLQLSAIWPFVLGTVLIVLLPGANSLYVLTASARTGAQAGARAAAGIVVGDTVLMTLSILGAATVLHSGTVFFSLLKWAGAVYLAWLGIGLIRNGIDTIRRAKRGEGTVPPQTEADFGAPFRRALITCLLNPKSILFFAAFFVQFINPKATGAWLTFLVLGAIMQAVSISYLSTLIVLGSKLGRRAGGSSRLVVVGLFAAGIVFCGFAARLAWGA